MPLNEAKPRQAADKMVNTALLFGHSQQIHLIQGYEDKTGNCEKKTEKEEEKS